MAQMVVVYKTPDDVEAFDRHYFGVHAPLAKKLPGLRKYEVSARPITTLGSPAETHFIATPVPSRKEIACISRLVMTICVFGIYRAIELPKS